MAKPLGGDTLWCRIEPLLPPPKPCRFRSPGRDPLDRRKVLTGIAWEDLPRKMGCGSGMSCLNYLKAWHRAGVRVQLHQILLREFEDAGEIDRSRGTVDGSMARALGCGEDTGRNPTDRGKLGSKHHLLTDADGVPLNVTTTGVHGPEVNEVLDRVDSAPEAVTSDGEPRRHPDVVSAARAYDSAPHRQAFCGWSIGPRFARRWTGHGSGLGVYRWVVERTAAWLHSFRRLRLRTDRNGTVQDAFVALGSALICSWFL